MRCPLCGVTLTSLYSCGVVCSRVCDNSDCGLFQVIALESAKGWDTIRELVEENKRLKRRNKHD